LKGAHCPVCKEQGPDLAVWATPWSTSVPVPEDMSVDVEFICSGCGRHWHWRAWWLKDHWAYVLVVPAPTRPPDSTIN
jgi:hypothetical protein